MKKEKILSQNEKIWQDALLIIKEELPASALVWIDYLNVALPNEKEFEEDFFVLKSHMPFAIRHLNDNYFSDIQRIIDKTSNSNIQIKLVQTTEIKKPTRKEKEQEKFEKIKEQFENLKQMQSFASLDLKYTFDNFIEGENSKIAYNAAKMIAQNPGKKFNPFFITGSVGLGKTHLMQAIGHEIIKNFPNLKVKYVKAEDFANRIISSLYKDGFGDKMKQFHDTYRNVDVLLMDDIQFSEGKKKTQEEIFHTFDTLFYNGKQIVFASDRPIEELKTTDERLKSRYEWGLSVEIKPPSFETRVEIVKNHAKRSNFEISDDVAKLLAEHFYKNVRELEGAYNKVSAHASIQGVELTVDFAKEVLNIQKTAKKITPKEIISECAKYHNINSDDITGNLRTNEIKNARQEAIYLTRKILELSLPEIAKIFNRNHTTVLYSCDKMQEKINTNSSVKKTMDLIEEKIRGTL